MRRMKSSCYLTLQLGVKVPDNLLISNVIRRYSYEPLCMGYILNAHHIDN